MLTDLLVKNASSDRLYVEDVFSTWLYTGNGSTQTITNGINLSGKGGMVWVKARNQAVGHWLTDTSRGATKSLQTNSNIAQQTKTAGISSFSATGFNIGDDGDFNDAARNYASWTFREAPKFFDVVTYTGTGTVQNISHNLGSVPGMIIIKSVSIGDWSVYHRSTGNTQVLFLNSTSAAATSSSYWNNTTPTSTVFTVGVGGANNNNGVTYVAYIFAHNAGGFGLDGAQNVISCGSFTTDGSGAYSVNLGWEPQFILVKQTNSTANWYLYDTMRGLPDTYNGGVELYPNTSGTEQLYASARPSATGFYSTNFAGAGATHIYLAIRRGPMRTPTDATKVFAPIARTATGATANVTTSFAPDAVISFQRTGVVGGVTPSWFDRLRGALRYLYTSSTAAEATTNSNTLTAFNNTTYTVGSDPGGLINNTTLTYVNYAFGRASGFFDVVCYTGNLTARTISHNLSVAPEMIIVKNRGAVSQWSCYHIALGNAGSVFLNLNNAGSTSGSTFWNSTTPTSTVFSLGANATVNANNNTYVAYLLATCPGVSKVGSYTGTGTTLQINCGFTNGARFVLIKRTDSTGDWYVWDTARGIIAGNDPYFLLNTADAEVTNTDYVDAYSAGFELSSTAPAALNANGGTYIFLAIA